MPFTVVNYRTLQCHHGKDKNKKGKDKRNAEDAENDPTLQVRFQISK